MALSQPDQGRPRSNFRVANTRNVLSLFSNDAETRDPGKSMEPRSGIVMCRKVYCNTCAHALSLPWWLGCEQTYHSKRPPHNGLPGQPRRGQDRWPLTRTKPGKPGFVHSAKARVCGLTWRPRPYPQPGLPARRAAPRVRPRSGFPVLRAGDDGRPDPCPPGSGAQR